MRLTAANIVSAIGRLPRDVRYNYVNPRNKGSIEIVRVVYPEGPIIIRRWSGRTSASRTKGKEDSISTQMIWRVANAFRPDYPINLDRVLGGSYNTRSVLEALLAHTPEFYTANPGRIESLRSTSTIRRGHKHLVWCPDEPHEQGIIVSRQVDIVISEIPGSEVYYDVLALPEKSHEIDIEVRRRHAQIQIALIKIGQQLGFKTYVAQNDQGIVYRDKAIGEMDGVITTLTREPLLASFQEAANAARMIDCVWFKNGRLMPAVIEIEHTTGVTSGLSRMKTFQDLLPPYPTRYVIVAPDDDRPKVVAEASKEQFASLKTRFFPYTAVEELYSLCERRKLRGVSDEFLDCFMEEVWCHTESRN